MSKLVKCDICGKKDERWFANRYLLGCDDVMCWYFYCEWYDGSVTDRQEIMHRSRLARYLATQTKTVVRAGGE